MSAPVLLEGLEIERDASASVSAAADAAGSSREPAEVLVRFKTSIAALQMPNAAPLALPTSLTRAGLTKVVHHLLGLEATAEGAGELEFFLATSGIGGGVGRRSTLLRGSLGRHLAALRIPFESTIVLEYALPAPPPQARLPQSHDEWLGAVDGGETLVAVGAYDGSLSLQPLAALLHHSDVSSVTRVPDAHTGAVLCVHVLELAAPVGTGKAAVAASAVAIVGSGGADGAVRLWRHAAGRLAQTAELAGCRGPVRAVRVDPSGSLIAGADATGGVLLWRCAEDGDGLDEAAAAAAAATAAAARGKRARAADALLAGKALRARAPVLALTDAHRGAATGLAWLSSAALASCGLDGTVRVWEISAAATTAASSASAGAVDELSAICTRSLAAGKAALALTASPVGALLASAHADGRVRVWEAHAREAGDTSVADDAASLRATLAPRAGGSGGGEDALIMAVSWCPTSGHHLAVAAAHLGEVTLWDVRAPDAPLARANSHAPGRALAVAWAGPEAGVGAEVQAILSGGTDKMLRCATLPALSQ